jgi:multidrug efflux pump subunit AcrA (membrane-fusion protein)
MPGFLRRPAFWIVIVVIALIGGGFFYMKGQAAEKKKKLEAAAALEEPSPYAAIANGKADVEGGVIQVAARRQGIVREVFVQEGETVVKGQALAKQEDDDARLAAQTSSANLASARAQLSLYQVQLRTAQREYKRLQGWRPPTSWRPRSWTPRATRSPRPKPISALSAPPSA